jgi:predicted nuclease of predicted toxin-antitoxin system
MSDASDKQHNLIKENIRFHLDERVDPDIASALRRFRIDVTTTVEAGLRTLDDEAQLAYACAERRVIVTHDADFLRLASQSNDHPGIAYCHQTSRSIGEIIRTLILIYEVLTPEEMAGRVEFL